jgi:hypothetical protein
MEPRKIEHLKAVSRRYLHRVTTPYKLLNDRNEEWNVRGIVEIYPYPSPRCMYRDAAILDVPQVLVVLQVDHGVAS